MVLLADFFQELDIPAGYTMEKALISLYGPDESLKKAAYFHHSITLEDIVINQ